MQISTFRIGEQLYGINIIYIKEICNLLEIFPIPGAKKFEYGLMNLRGNVISVIHPSLFTEYDNNLLGTKNKLLIFKNDDYLRPLLDIDLLKKPMSLGKDLIGLIIDTISDVIEIDDEKEIGPLTPNIPEKLNRILSGVIYHNRQLILIIDLQKFNKNISYIY